MAESNQQIVPSSLSSLFPPSLFSSLFRSDWDRLSSLSVESWRISSLLKAFAVLENVNEIINKESESRPQFKSQLLFLCLKVKNPTFARIIMKMKDCFTLVSPDKDTSTIIIACQQECEDVVQCLFSKPFYYQAQRFGREFNLKEFDDFISEMNSKLLHQSIQNNKPGIVNILIDNGVTLINQDGVTALHLACEHNQLDIVRLLVQSNGTSVNAKTNVNGYTPLHLAVISNATEIVEFLLNKGANANAEATDSETPLHLACKNNCREVARVFMSQGADATIKTKSEGLTPLHFACKFGCFEVARMILVENMNRVNGEDLMNIADRSGVTPFHLICEKAPEDFIIYAMDKCSADLNKPNEINGRYPLHYACIRDDKIVSAMMNRGADIDSQDNEGNTALHIACRTGNEAIIKTLLKYLPNKTLENRDGRLAKDLISNETLKSLFDETFILPYYPINRRKERGYCLIINIQNFPNNPGINRHGSDIDRDRLKSTFEKLRYKVLICNDPKLKDIQSKMKELTRKVNQNHDSVVVCLLSHGAQNFIITSDQKQYHYRNCILQVLGPKNCPAMKLKPKIVIVQACRGNERDLGVTTDSVNIGGELMPTQSDFLFCYSTVEDFVAYRSPTTGSSFIRILCRCIDMFHNEEDIGFIFTRVNALLSKETMNVDGIDYAATCELVSRLTKVFMFG